ncbi:MAG: TrkA-like protein, partial [uncultured Thermomicrobiales bacterium]
EGGRDGLRSGRCPDRFDPGPQRPRRQRGRRRTAGLQAPRPGLRGRYHHRHGDRRGRAAVGRDRDRDRVRRRHQRRQSQHHGGPGRPPGVRGAGGRLPDLRPGAGGHLPPPGADHRLPDHHRLGPDPRPRHQRRRERAAPGAAQTRRGGL